MTTTNDGDGRKVDSNDGEVNKKKTLLIFKKKRVASSGRKIARLSGESLRQPRTSRVAATSQVCGESLSDCGGVESLQNDDQNSSYFVDLGPIMCDTWELIRSLQQERPITDQKCLAIPLSSPSPDILCILECQLYAGGLDQTVVMRDLTELSHTNQIRRLSPPKSTATFTSQDVQLPTVLLTRQDFDRGVRDALQNYKGSSMLPFPQQQHAIEWFLANVQTSQGDRISESDLEMLWKKAYHKSPIFSSNGSIDTSVCRNVLEFLVQIQVLLPCYSENFYQLWLPSWPIVLRAWSNASKSIFAQLKRSNYKERSLASLARSTCPIPIPLIIQYLVSLDRIQLVDKPCGKVVQLPK